MRESKYQLEVIFYIINILRNHHCKCSVSVQI